MNMIFKKIYQYFTILDGELICKIVFVFLFLFMIFVLGFRFIKNKKIRDKVLSSRFIEANHFLKSKNPIYKNGEFSKSGCYVILIFSSPIHDGNYKKFDDIYIGQSLNLSKRMKQHFAGNGNKNVYRDYQKGKFIYFTFQRCQPSYMNRMEKDLIRAFHSTESYNVQKGGGKHRKNIDNWKYQ